MKRAVAAEMSTAHTDFSTRDWCRGGPGRVVRSNPLLGDLGQQKWTKPGNKKVLQCGQEVFRWNMCSHMQHVWTVALRTLGVLRAVSSTAERQEGPTALLLQSQENSVIVPHSADCQQGRALYDEIFTYSRWSVLWVCGLKSKAEFEKAFRSFRAESLTIDLRGGCSIHRQELSSFYFSSTGAVLLVWVQEEHLVCLSKEFIGHLYIYVWTNVSVHINQESQLSREKHTMFMELSCCGPKVVFI